MSEKKRTSENQAAEQYNIYFAGDIHAEELTKQFDACGEGKEEAPEHLKAAILEQIEQEKEKNEQNKEAPKKFTFRSVRIKS